MESSSDAAAAAGADDMMMSRTCIGRMQASHTCIGRVAGVSIPLFLSLLHRALHDDPSPVLARFTFP